MNEPNNVCVVKREIPDGGGTQIVYEVVTRYNFSPEPLGAQHCDAILFRRAVLAEAVAEARAVAHSNHSLAVCCSSSLSGRAECDGLAMWGAPTTN